MLDRPMHLKITPDDKIYVAEFANDRIQIFDLEGKSLALIGSSGKGAGEFDAPGGVGVDRQGRIYVADFYNHRVQPFSANYSALPQIGKKGRIFGGNFDYPTDVAIGPDDSLYVADGYNNRIQKFSPEGEFVTKWGGFLGTGLKGDSSGSFDVATGIEVDAQGRVFVADFYNNRIQIFNSAGDFLVEFGAQGNAAGEFDRPTDMTVDSQGNIYVVDFGNNRIQKFSALTAKTKHD